jgi:adenylate cyclase class 2
VNDSPTETEIKVPVDDLDILRRRLLRVGAGPLEPKHDEDNTLYDDAESRLVQAGCTLRLRTGGAKALLTFKGPSSFEGGIKTREELQTEVSDPGALRSLLQRLGFAPRFRYQKRREEFRLGDCTICLDETPIGTFVEIEGEAPAIPEALAALELRAADAVRESYVGLYARRRRENPSLPRDMLFSR